MQQDNPITKKSFSEGWKTKTKVMSPWKIDFVEYFRVRYMVHENQAIIDEHLNGELKIDVD